MKEIRFPSLRASDLIRLAPASEHAPLSLHNGQILSGEVIEIVDDHHAVIRFQGRNLPVENRMPLGKGMRGLFEVQALFPQVVLRVIRREETCLQEIERRLQAFLMAGPSTEELLKTRSRLWSLFKGDLPSPVRETMDRLMALWEASSDSHALQIDPKRLQEIIARSGIFFESRLRHLVETKAGNQCAEVLGKDGKGLLIKLQSQIEAFLPPAPPDGPNPPALEKLLAVTKHLLLRIEGCQILNASPSDLQEKIFLLLPFWFQERFHLIDLYLSLPSPRPDRSDPEAFSMLFILDLPEWGRMSIEVKMAGKRIYCRFYLPTEEVKSFFGSFLDQVQERLVRLGFQPQVAVSARATEKIAEFFLNEVRGGSKSILDFFA